MSVLTPESIDNDAFNHVPDMITGMDLIEDDLPTNLDYLDRAARKDVKVDRKTGETLRSWESAGDDDDPDIASEAKGETIKLLYTEPFDMDEGYWDELPPVTNGYLDQ